MDGIEYLRSIINSINGIGAKTAIFFSPVGTIGKLFMRIEEDAFEMDASR